MKKQAEENLMMFQASGMELVALGSAILYYGRYLDASQHISGEEREMAQYLRRFYDRLVTQLPPRKHFGPPQ